MSGSAQPVLNTPLIANLPVISAESVSQKYIGDKVRQAEQLRVWAKRLYRIPAFIDAFIQGALPLSLTDLLFSLIKKSNNDAIKELTKFLALNIEDAQMKQNFQGFIEKNKMGSVDIEREFFTLTLFQPQLSKISYLHRHTDQQLQMLLIRLLLKSSLLCNQSV